MAALQTGPVRDLGNSLGLRSTTEAPLALMDQRKNYNGELTLADQPPICIAAFLHSANSVDNPANLAGGISGDRALCSTHHLSESAGRDSPESKPLESRNATTGEANK